MKVGSIVKSVLLFCLCSLHFCVHTTESYSFVAKLTWGDGSFAWPSGVAVDASGNTYLVDANRVQKFDSSGEFVKAWGSYGLEEGQFIKPQDIAVDARGNVFVVDANRVHKFDSAGRFLTRWGSYGSGDGQFSGPRGIAVDSEGNVFVGERKNRIQKFDSSGKFLMKWGSYGSEDGEFLLPRDVAVDLEGNVYVLDTENYRIQKFDSSGKFLAKWGSHGSEDGSFGTVGYVGGPRGLAVDSKGNVFVADSGNNRIQKFDSSGRFLTAWGSEGSGEGQFKEPQGIAVDSAGNVYVADTKNNRIQKFKPPRPETIDTSPRQVRREPEKETRKVRKRTLTIDDVLLLNQLGIEEETILEKIQTAGKRFSAEEVEKLRQAGLSKEFIERIPKLDEAKEKKLTVHDILLLHELGFSEEVILKKIGDSGTTFSAEEIEQLQQAGFNEAFTGNLPKSNEKKMPKLTADNVVLLKELGIDEDSILKKITESGSAFVSEDLKQFEEAGFSEAFIARLSPEVKEKQE